MSSTIEEDNAMEAFVREAPRQKVNDEQEDMKKGSEKAGHSSSSDECYQPDLNKFPTSMVQRSEEIFGRPSAISPLSTHSLQQRKTSPSMAKDNVDDRKRIRTSSESVVVEHKFLSKAMQTTNDESILKSAHSSGSSKNSVKASKEHPLPISNIPPEFRLSFSSRNEVPQTQQRNWTSGSSLDKTNWQPFSEITTHEPDLKLGSQGFRFQALLNQAMASDNFHVKDDRPIQQRVGSSAIGVSSPVQLDDIPSKPNKRKITWQDDTPPTPNLPFIDWMSVSPREANRGQNDSVPTASGSRSKIIKNKVYDPSYAAMGLPVDPHLRMLLAKHANVEKKYNTDNNRENCGSKAMPR